MKKTDCEKLVDAINSKDKNTDLLEKILKDKCSKRIERVLKDNND